MKSKVRKIYETIAEAMAEAMQIKTFETKNTHLDNANFQQLMNSYNVYRLISNTMR